MGRKRKYTKRLKSKTTKGENPQKLTEEIKTLVNELVTSYDNMLLSIRGDLIRVRARIKERQLEV